ncbi:unnamed protein product [Didymodactylos carnosus]|uniref:Uncharacterized protein n=1 Tax=Didymodactylos carnosus TaxID=1234261 RepID=A0A8S2FYP2_9BILA|nr:unnamed protein product [Didymodactylos carnosus]CAF4365198.1 unnamed protein product [Didymodactylos carnosus]
MKVLVIEVKLVDSNELEKTRSHIQQRSVQNDQRKSIKNGNNNSNQNKQDETTNESDKTDTTTTINDKLNISGRSNFTYRKVVDLTDCTKSLGMSCTKKGECCKIHLSSPHIFMEIPKMDCDGQPQICCIPPKSYGCIRHSDCCHSGVAPSVR